MTNKHAHSTTVFLVLVAGLCACQYPLKGQEAGEKSPPSTAKTTLNSSDIIWQSISPEGSGFEALLPGEPRLVSREIALNADEKSPIQMYIVALQKGKLNVVIAYHDVQEIPKNDKQRNEILDGGIAGTLLRLIPSKLVPWDANADEETDNIDRQKIDGHMARRFAYRGMQRGREIAGHSQLILDGRRVFQISIIRTGSTAPDEALADRFFNAFKLTPVDKNK
ncbi:MAG: hypothetical protein P8J33_08595 [Pirellulaceae bacterium]|nr:hypothetical protein [Pirellulaceae bacterium]